MRALVVVVAACVAAPALAQKEDPVIARGRYISQIGGCNDCHTPGYGPSGGKVAEAQRLTGDALGWHGPWGTTYPTNLRLYFQGITEGEWLKKAKTLEARPPMPWFNVRAMTDADLRALYRYVRHLGPAGKPAPAYLPPDQAPSGPEMPHIAIERAHLGPAGKPAPAYLPPDQAPSGPVVEFPAPPKH